MAGQQFEANLGDSGHSGAECQPHWETGHLAGNRTPASYLQSNGIGISIGNQGFAKQIAKGGDTSAPV